MKRLFPIISILLTSALLIVVFTAVPFSVNAESNPSFVVDSVTAEPGARDVAVNVSVKNNPGISSALLDIGYDKTALTLKGFTYNTSALDGAMTVPFNANAKTYSLSMVSGTKNINGDFVFATLYFDVAENAHGNYNITLSYDENNVYDINENNISFEVVKGSVSTGNEENPTQPTNPSSGNSPAFVAGEVNAEAGAKDVAVTVSVKNNPGIASILLDIGYNKSALTLKGFTYNSSALDGAMTVPFNANAKTYSLSMVSGTKNINGDFDFATLYFDVADNAGESYDITLSYDENNVYDINENNINFEVINGKINVGGEISPTEPNPGDSPSFIVDKVEADAGAKNVAVNVTVKNNPGISSALLDIGYDKNALTLKGFDYNTSALDGAMTVPFNANASQYSLSMVNGTKNVNGDFVFATLYFDVADNASGSYNIMLSYDENNVYNINEDNIEFTVVNGAINIKKATNYLIGDVNGDKTVDILDAVLIQKYTVDKIKFDDRQKYVADTNKDGAIDILDAVMIQKYAVNKIDHFIKNARCKMKLKQ